MSKLAKLQTKVKPIDMVTATSGAYDRQTGRALQSTRWRIMDREGFRCKRCGLPTLQLEIDHIVPLHLGGAESDENRQALCISCHRVKSEAEERDRGGGGIGS